MSDTKLKEAEDATQAARQELAEVKAGVVLDAALKEANLPEATAKKLSALASKATLKDDGSLDEDAFGTTVKEAIASEVAYLTEVTGAGQIRNMGGGDADPAKVEGELAEAFQDIGLPESTAKVAATGRK